MESLVLNLQSKKQISDYRRDNHLIQYERVIFQEILAAIKLKDQQQLDWFRSFGDSFRAVTMNVHAYRKGLEFGFGEIAFDKYGWFERPVFLSQEELTFGDTSRYGSYSTIKLGKGPNETWTYAISYSYGVAGGGYDLSVYGKQFKNRMDALGDGLLDLKSKMTARIGSTDTTNDKQAVIVATLRDIEKEQINRVQLSLF